MILRPLSIAALAALATLGLALSVAAPSGARAEPVFRACDTPTSLCSADQAIALKANAFDERTRRLNQEVRLRIDPTHNADFAVSSSPAGRRLRTRWRRIEAEALRLAHLSPDDLIRLINRVRQNLEVAIRRAPQLSSGERAMLIAKAEGIPVHLPSESSQPLTATHHCGSSGTALQAYAAGVDEIAPEVVLCPGLLLLENLTPEHEAWVLEGLPSPLQTVIAHELSHHFTPADTPAPAQTALRSCLVNTLGIADRPEQIEEIVADFWASEMMAVAIESPLEPRKAIRRSLILATLPVCLLEQRLPPTDPQTETDSHFRALPRMTLSLAYHPRIQPMMGCDGFTPAHPTCDLGGTFPK